jgi:hypothetical protein
MALQPKNPLQSITATLRKISDRHNERHSPTGFGFAFADRIDYLDAARWDQAVDGQSTFMRRGVLRHIELHGPENVQPRYVLMFRGDRPVAAVAAQVVTLTGDQLQANADVAREKEKKSRLGAVKKVFSPAGRRVAEKWEEKILVAGNVLAWGFHGIAFARAEDPAALWPGIGEALYRLRRAHRLLGQADFVMVKDITAAQSGLERLERWSYRPLETEPNMVLKIDPRWGSYEDYLAALDSKYRKNCKDQAKKLSAAGCVIEPLADVRPHARRLHELYLNVIGNAAVRLVTLPENYLPGLAEALGNDFSCHAVRRGNEFLGFVTAVRDGETAIGYLIGFDREAASGLPIYLRLLHSTLNDAIRWKCTRLSLGRTALEPKAALGAKPEPMSIYVRHRFPVMNWVMRGMLGSIPHAEAPERSPFKTKAAKHEF